MSEQHELNYLIEQLELNILKQKMLLSEITKLSKKIKLMGSDLIDGQLEIKIQKPMEQLSKTRIDS